MSNTYLDGANGNLVIASGTASSIGSDSGSIAASQTLATATRTEIVFIEDNVGDIQSLVQQIGSGREVVILDATKDGLQQIAQILDGRSGIDALHIISHGAAGSAKLGTLSLDADNMGAHQAELATIGASLSAGADILLYGCDIGSGAGKDFVGQLAVATGADVAASSDLTGSAVLGGDWDLEVRSGQVETASLGATSYGHVLSSNSALVDFETIGNARVSGGNDVRYILPENPQYELAVRSPGAYIGDQEGYGNDDVGIMMDPATPIEIAFAGGQNFSISSLSLGVIWEGIMGADPGFDPMPHYGYADTHTFLTVEGIAANGTLVDRQKVDLVATANGDYHIQFHTLNFSGMSGVQVLRLIVDENSSAPFLYLDNLALSNISASVAAPPAAPAAPASLLLDIASDSGISHTDGLTKVTTPTVHGTAEAGATVKLYDTFGAELGSDTADANGNWTITSSTLDEGAHTLSAKATNGGGMTSDASAALEIRIDTQAPSGPTPALDAASDTGLSNSDGITADTTPTITGSSKYDDKIKLYEVVDEQLVERGSTTASDGQWHIDSTELGAGTHRLVTQATDAAGNTGALSDELVVNIVTDAPTARAISAALSSDTGASSTDFITNDYGTQTITGSLSAALANGEYVQVSVDNGQHWVFASVSGTDWSLATSMPAGSHELQVRVINAVDKTGDVYKQAFSLDLWAPSVAITSDVPSLKAGETATITFTFSEDPGSSFHWDGSTGSLEVSGGTLSAIAGTGTVRTATFTPGANVNDGTAIISVSAGAYTDLAGNGGNAASFSALSFDTKAPFAPTELAFAAGSDTGVSSTDGITGIATPVITGSADNGTTIKLYEGAIEVGSGTVIDHVWSIETTHLLDGEHLIVAKAFDAAGNVSEVSRPLYVKIDTGAPGVSAPVLDTGSDSGISHTDGLTNVTTPTVHGTAEAGATVKLYDTNGAELGSGTADVNGNWTITSSTLDEGFHALTAKATDAAGNTGDASAPLEMRIDTFGPRGPSPHLDAASDTGVSNSDGITADTTPTITGSSKYDDKIKLYELVDEQLVELGSTTASGGQWHIDSAELKAGTHHLVTQATDAAGNTGMLSEELVVNIVTDAPTTHAVSASLEKDSGVSNTDFITRVDTQSVSGTLNAELAQGERVQVSADGQTWQDATVEGSSWTLATTLQPGSHELQVRVINAVDNAGPVYKQAYTLDLDAPSVTIASDVASLKAGQTATITFTFSEDPGSTFSWDGSAGSVVVSGGTLSALEGTGAVRTAIFTPDAGTNQGSASITIAAAAYADLAGNAGTAGATPALHFDTLAPGVPSVPVLAAGSDTGVSSTDNLTAKDKPTFTGTAESGTTVTLYNGKGAAIGVGTAVDGVWAITPTVALANGTQTIVARALDAAGNLSAFSSKLTITVDKTPPTLAITSDVAQLKIGETATITFTFSEDPGSSFMRSDVSVEGGSIGALSGSGLTRSAVFTPAVGVDGGTASITVNSGTYTDAVGNAGGAGATPVLRFDTKAPAAPSTPDLDDAADTGASSSDDITGNTLPTFSGAAEDGAKVTLHDGERVIGSATAIDGKWQITSELALEKGSHAITATVTDAAGNAGPASSALTIKVLTDAPATTVSGLALSSDSGASGTDFVTRVAEQTISGSLGAALATGEHVEVSIDGGQSWVTAAAAAGDADWSLAATLASGTHDIKVKVIDALGNSGPVLTQAYMLDTVAPGVTIASDVAQLKAGETATITFTFSEDPGSSFTRADVQVEGGTLGELAGSGLTRSAVFTPAAGIDGGAASITVGNGAYADVAGNAGGKGISPILSFDTLAPAAPVVSGVMDGTHLDSDKVVKVANPTFSGTASEGTIVTLYDSDTGVKLGEANAPNGAWALTSPVALQDGVHHVYAVARDAAGNVGTAGESLAITVDTAAPTVAIASDATRLKAGESATFTFTFSEDPGMRFDANAIVVTGTEGTFGAMTGTGLTRSISFTPKSGVEGTVKIGVGEGFYSDAAGNGSAAAESPSLAIDTLAPAAPAAPRLAAASDTGQAGDGHTEATSPVIEGTALANALVTLYDGERKIGSVTADDAGNWHIAAANLAHGNHALSATQSDAAGNVSSASDAFTLAIDEPPATLVDGMPVETAPVVLPGGVSGTQVTVPVVTSGRPETTGAAGVADIPLASNGAANLLLAQLPTGYGLSASGANVGSANALEFLISSIKAATPDHAQADQGHLAANGSSFLAGLAASTNLLVQTVTPVSASASGTLTLSGTGADAGQNVALVIETGKLAAGSTIALQHVDFAAIIGAASVVATNGKAVLSGDAAAQDFTVAQGDASSVFAGAGSDTLSFGASAAATLDPASGQARAQAAPATTLLHGGQDGDTATFTGARADYNVEQHNGYLVVSSKAAPDAKALVVNVEQLQFSDASVTVQNNADMTQLAGVYQTMFGRQADMKGIEFWADAHQAGASLGTVAVQMMNSAEYLGGHEAMNGNAAHDVGLLYQALFNRAADAEGLAFWTNHMDHGLSLEQVAADMMQSVEIVGHQRAAQDWDFSV